MVWSQAAFMGAFWIGLLVVAAPAPACAQPASSAPAAAAITITSITITGPARPPYLVDRDGLGTGPAADLVRAIAAGTGIDPTIRIRPFRRALLALDQGSTLYPALLRSAEREGRYHWIGEVFRDNMVFFTLSGRPAITDFHSARHAGKIGILNGSTLQNTARKAGLTDMEEESSDANNARKLRAWRLDGWFALRSVGRATWAELGYDPRELQASESFGELPFWIAASANIPLPMIHRLQAEYQRLVKDGSLERAISPLRHQGMD